MKKFPALLFSLLAPLVVVLAPAVPAYAASTTDVFTEACKNAQDGIGCENGKAATGSGIFSIIRTVIQVMLIIGGIIAVIMIILGGIRYTTSNGDQADVKAAKDTILYAIVGLVVTMGGYAIVTWVVGRL